MKKIVLLLLLFCCGIAHAQLDHVRVSRISAISQLPVSAITCVYQDSEGFMWYGTVDGVCRDDGYNVHVFRSDFHTPGLMDINSVFRILYSGRQKPSSMVWYAEGCLCLGQGHLYTV